MCSKDGYGLDFFDVDIHVGGKAHDLLDEEIQEDFLSEIANGEFDMVILSPPCGTWSRLNWANDDGPAPCRDRFEPWGFTSNQGKRFKRNVDTAGQRRRAEDGNTFVHFSIRAIVSARQARERGQRVRCLLEHPEDLGRVGPGSKHQGVPASIWQFGGVGSAFGSAGATTVAGWQ